MTIKELREKRKQAGLTQNNLAEQIGISRSTLSLIERGERKPSFDVMTKIAKALNEPLEIK